MADTVSSFCLHSGKTCPMYDPPRNGALACYKANDADYVCLAMCKDGYHFVFNPAYMYFCSTGQWYHYVLPSFPDSKQLPWPDCSSKSLFRITVSKDRLT